MFFLKYLFRGSNHSFFLEKSCSDVLCRASPQRNVPREKKSNSTVADVGGTAPAAFDWLASTVGVSIARTLPESFHFEAYAMKNMHI